MRHPWRIGTPPSMGGRVAIPPRVCLLPPLCLTAKFLREIAPFIISQFLIWLLAGVIPLYPMTALGGTLSSQVITRADFDPALYEVVREQTPGTLPLPLQPNDPRLLSVETLDVSGRGLSSLKGIEFFTNLRALSAGHNQLTLLGGQALPPRLEYLDLSYNEITAAVNLILPETLAYLDLSHNLLSSLDPFDFPEGLARLNVSDNFLWNQEDHPAGRQVTLDGNFIEGPGIRPASLIYKGTAPLFLTVGQSARLLFQSFYSSVRDDTPVPPELLQIAVSDPPPVRVTREPDGFYLESAAPGNDTVMVSIWYPSADRAQTPAARRADIPLVISPALSASNPLPSGEAAVLEQLRVTGKASVNLAQYTAGASFTPAFLQSLANQGQSLILRYYDKLTIELTVQALQSSAFSNLSPNALIQLGVKPLPLNRLNPQAPFSRQGLYAVPNTGFLCDAKIHTGYGQPRNILFDGPVRVTWNLSGQALDPYQGPCLTGVIRRSETRLGLLGGWQDTDNQALVCVTQRLGDLYLAQSQTLSQIRMTLGDLAASWNGRPLSSEVAPYLYQGRVMIPAAWLEDSLGVHIQWDPLLEKALWNDHGHGGALTSGRTEEPDPIMMKGVLMAPLRLLNQTLDLEIQYFPKTRTLRINGN
jgi:hypothetical protein